MSTLGIAGGMCRRYEETTIFTPMGLLSKILGYSVIGVYDLQARKEDQLVNL